MKKPSTSFTGYIKEYRSTILLIILISCFRSAIADWNTVPTGSMKPTILEGDRIFVNKMAYDLRVPFTHVSLLKLGEPESGDIIVFESEIMDKRLVKRVIGVPGDTVALKDNKLIINGIPSDYDIVNETHFYFEQKEKTIDSEQIIRVAKDFSYLSNFNAVVVPENHYLVLGDNRNNSADSRVIGFVPREEIVGESLYTVISLNYDNYYLPRKDRYFQRL